MIMTMRPPPLLLMGLIISVTITVSVAQGTGGDQTSCAQSLTGCFAYLNKTSTPPAVCCDPLKNAVTNQKPCLCNLYKNPAILKGFGVNITQAMNLPVRCNIPTKTAPADFCKDLAPSGSPSSTTPGSGTKTGSATTITGTGFVSGLFMFVTYALLC